MPLTELQTSIGRLLAANRSEDSYLAGETAILAEPNTQRFSRDLDYFHDSETRVATAYEADHKSLVDEDYQVETLLSQPGYIQAVVRKNNEATKVEWAQDSTWRFMPVIESRDFGYQLHPVDLATNKVLALAGREEPRDLIDTLYLHQATLSLGAMVWAAAGKDPGFSPLSLLELLKRRSRIRPEELARLDLVAPLDVGQIKIDWTAAINEAESFVQMCPPQDVGCLYYSISAKEFVTPKSLPDDDIVCHFGRPGGVLPRLIDNK